MGRKKALTWEDEIDEIGGTELATKDSKTETERLIHVAPTITNDVEMAADILENAFRMDATVEEACILAGISVATYYKWVNKDETLKRRFNLAKDWSKMIAHAAIYNKMRKGDAKIALQFLKLRDKRYKDIQPLGVEGEDKAPIVQFISVDTNKGDGTKMNGATDTEQKLLSDGYANIGENVEEVEKKTNWENEEQVLKNIDLWASNNE